MRYEDKGVANDQWDPQVMASIAAAVALMWGDEVEVYPGRMRIREEWPRTTLWRWL